MYTQLQANKQNPQLNTIPMINKISNIFYVIQNIYIFKADLMLTHLAFDWAYTQLLQGHSLFLQIQKQGYYLNIFLHIHISNIKINLMLLIFQILCDNISKLVLVCAHKSIYQCKRLIFTCEHKKGFTCGNHCQLCANNITLFKCKMLTKAHLI